MRRTLCKFALATVWVLCPAACEQPAERVVLETKGVRPELHYYDLAIVLERVVTDDGLVIPMALRQQADRLERQLALLAVTGPTATPAQLPTEADRVAYWYNARAAWAMKLADLCQCPKEMRRGHLVDRAFPLDGRVMSLSAIDSELAEFEDWRVLVASPGVTLSRCRLPAEPFSAEDVHRRIDERLNQFIDDGKRFVVDVARKTVVVPPILWQYRDRLTAEYNRKYQTRGATFLTAMLPHTTGPAHRRLQDAIGYRCIPAGPSLLVALFEE